MGQAVGGIFGNALFGVLAENIKQTREKEAKAKDLTALNFQGPELIRAGTAAAFDLGRPSARKTEDKIEDNTKQTYEEIKRLAAQLAAGLKVNIRNIEAFAP